MAEDNKGKKSKYYELMEQLKRQILNGDYKEGEKMPSENQLSAQYHVSRQTVRKALEILENAGYVYAEHGRGTFCSKLVHNTKKSHNIAVVMTYLSDYIFPRIIKGIDEVLTEKGYSIILKNTRNSRANEAKCLEELLQKQIDGIIIEPSKSQIFCRHMNLYKQLDEYKIPYVFIQGAFMQMKGKPEVLLDDVKGGYLITDYLIKLGHRQIVGVFKADDIQGQNRHHGYVKALQDSGIMYEPENVIWFYTEDRTVHPYECVKQMVEAGRQIDAIVCYNDMIAVEVIQALNKCGKQVPEDISVTGYDNSYMAQASSYSLTTIAHPQEDLGRMAAELMIRLIETPEQVKDQQILIEPKLIKGTSCARKMPVLSTVGENLE